MMTDLLFRLVQQDQRASFGVRCVTEDGVLKHQVSITRGAFAVQATAAKLDQAVRSALMSVEFQPVESDCQCDEGLGECLFHDWFI